MKAPTKPFLDSRVSETISTTEPAFNEVDPPATLSSLRWVEQEVRRFCTLPYIATCMVSDFGNSSASDGLWRYGQRVNIGARAMQGYCAVSHEEGSYAAGPQPQWLNSSGGGLYVYAEKDGRSGVHDWPPVSGRTFIATTGDEVLPGATTAGVRAHYLFLEDYAGASVAGVNAPYIEGFSCTNVVAVGGRYLPIYDLDAGPGAFVTEAGDPLTAETGDRLTEEQ